LKGVLAQRLVRRLCPACAAQAEMPKPLAQRLARLRHEGRSAGDAPILAWRATGCEKCRGTGYSGRTAIYELITMTDAVRGALVEEAGESAIAEAAARGGMVSMLENGVDKIARGETTLEEVLRVTSTGDAAV
jgi:type II secretory ATPase GspE/PulE/Tfp pilus assembly ATPase PilB-like protein